MIASTARFRHRACRDDAGGAGLQHPCPIPIRASRPRQLPDLGRVHLSVLVPDHRSVEPAFRVGRRSAGGLCWLRARRGLCRLPWRHPRIAIASGAAFLVAQLLDIRIFAKLRDRAWWLPPFVSSVISSALDTAIFFSFAFYCGPVPGVGITISDAPGRGRHRGCNASRCRGRTSPLADYCVKLLLAALSIAPYGAILMVMRRPRPPSGPD